MTPQHALLGCCLSDPACIDKAVAAGAGKEHFAGPLAYLWQAMIELRSASKPVEAGSLSLHLGKACPFESIFECEKAAPTTLNFPVALEQVLWARASSVMAAAADQLKRQLEGGAGRLDIGPLVESITGGMAEGQQAVARPIKTIVSEVTEWADRMDRGEKPEVGATLGFLDHHLQPIGKHELVIVGARPSQGKTSLSSQIVGENLGIGKRVAYFSLETSDVSVVKQIAAQRAKLNLRDYARSLPERKGHFRSCLAKMQTGSIFKLFDKTMRLDSIEAQCRLLKASWAPDLVVIDYLQIIQSGITGKPYDQITHIANKLVELRKMLDCPVIVCAQLNRVSVNENRAPRDADLRDSGAIEAAAHRIILLYKPTEDFSGSAQMGEDVESRDNFDYYIMQVKFRDGPTLSVKAKYNAPTTTFQSCNT
jgi:replicative DNA helicase